MSLIYLVTAARGCNGNHESERPMAIRWRLEREILAVWMDGCCVAHQLFLARHGASNPAVFGSVARDQGTPSSDDDLLLTRVDLIGRRNLKPDLKALVEAEAIPL